MVTNPNVVGPAITSENIAARACNTRSAILAIGCLVLCFLVSKSVKSAFAQSQTNGTPNIGQDTTAPVRNIEGPVQSLPRATQAPVNTQGQTLQIVPPVRPAGPQFTGLGTNMPLITVRQPIQSLLGPAPLSGWVDLHTHPMANLAFGGKFLYGGVDASPAGGSLLPADPNCNQNVYATSELQALGHDNSTHGGWGTDNPCGDSLRSQVIHAFQQQLNAYDPGDDASGDVDPSNPAMAAYLAAGGQNFPDWPRWNDLTHQRMWVEWIRRAYLGGLRVMVALAVNNKTLGDMTAGPGDYPTDDVHSVDLQIAEMKEFVNRHPDFMALALTSTDVYNIVSANKLAVVLGTEVDHIGNFSAQAFPSDAAVTAEIDRLHAEGVRYMFPIHLLDNAFGGTAAYIDLFNAANVIENGFPWALTCATSDNGSIQPSPAGYTYSNSSLGVETIVAQLVKLGGSVINISEPQCPSGVGQKNSRALTASGITAIKEMMRLGMLIDIDHMSEAAADQALQLGCYGSIGSTASPFTFSLPCTFGYPLNSGHNATRGQTPTSFNERSLRKDQYLIIGQLHGMAGVGSAKQISDSWLQLYNGVIQNMGGDVTYAKPYTPANGPINVGQPSNGIVAGFGTDMDGLEFAMPPRPGAGGMPAQLGAGPQYQQYRACITTSACKCMAVVIRGGIKPVGNQCPSPTYAFGPDANSNVGTRCDASCVRQYPTAATVVRAAIPPAFQYSSTFPPSTDSGRTWNYFSDGVAHYGMLWDFIQDVRSLPAVPPQGSGAAMVDNNFSYGADYFYRTWQRAEQLSKQAPN